jgi:hypothetical protein
MKRSRCLSALRLRPLPALLAELAYLKALAENDEWGWVFDECTGTAARLLESFVASIANISTAQVQS